MATGLKEFDFGDCLDRLNSDTPQEKIKRATNLLRGAFSHSDLTGDPVRLARFEEALKMATDVCSGTSTIEAFDSFRDHIMSLPEYDVFLHKAGTLPVNYWGALRAIATHSFDILFQKRQLQDLYG